MDFNELIRARRSVRAFKKAAVEKEKITRILDAANSAPSAGNLQAYEIVVVTERGHRDRLAEACYGQNFISDAPVALVFLANPKASESKYGGRGAKLYCVQDATIAAAYAQLMAANLGLATVWVGAFNDKAVASVVNAKDGLTPVAVLPIGYASEKPGKTGRRDIDDLVRRL